MHLHQNTWHLVIDSAILYQVLYRAAGLLTQLSICEGALLIRRSRQMSTDPWCCKAWIRKHSRPRLTFSRDSFQWRVYSMSDWDRFRCLPMWRTQIRASSLHRQHVVAAFSLRYQQARLPNMISAVQCTAEPSIHSGSRYYGNRRSWGHLVTLLPTPVRNVTRLCGQSHLVTV
jgi:hypothetical protein